MSTIQQNSGPYDGFMEKYPILFKQKDLPMSQTCMCWGICCPPGWLNLLTNVCDKLEFLNNTICKQYGCEIRAEQVKEKFASLRFYFSVYPIGDIDTRTDEDINKCHVIEEICYDIINNAEYQSENICQDCGKSIYSWDTYTSIGWIGYYCKDCAEKHPEKRFTPPHKEDAKAKEE